MPKKYAVTLHTSRPHMSEQQFEAWCKKMQAQFDWDTDFKELEDGTDEQIISVGGGAFTTLTVKVVQ